MDSDTSSTYKSDSDLDSVSDMDSDDNDDEDYDNDDEDYDSYQLSKILSFVDLTDILDKIPSDDRLISAMYLIDVEYFDDFQNLLSDIWSYHVPEVLLEHVIDLINSNDIDNMNYLMFGFENYKYSDSIFYKLDYNTIKDDTILAIFKISKFKYKIINNLLIYIFEHNKGLSEDTISDFLIKINEFSDIDKINQYPDKINQYESEFIQFIDNKLYKTIKDYNSVQLDIDNLKELFYVYKSKVILKSYCNKHNLPLSNQYLDEDNYINDFVMALETMILKEENFKKRELLLQQRRYKRDLKGIK